MSKLIKVAEDVKGLAKRFQGFFDLAQALEEIGSLEQAAKDAIIAKDKNYAEVEKSKAALEKAKEDFAKAFSEIEFAENKAKEIVNGAYEKATLIVSDANQKSLSVDAEIEKRKKLIDDKFVAAGKELVALESDILVKKQELNALKKEVEEVKQKFAALLK
jgi:hypothetical protein